jgi:hypothetical protein
MPSIKNTNIEADRQLIEQLGGATKVAKQLGLTGAHPVQRVQNWTVRGIPSAVKVQHPTLFMPNLMAELAESAQAATESVAEQGA